MDVLLPSTLSEALDMKAAHPGAVPIAGGTDVMVELNFDRARPEILIDLTRLHELREHGPDGHHYFLGAGVTYSRIMREITTAVALSQASRTVGSPQIRNRATVGGNLGTASPAGDALPVLAAYDAEVLCAAANNRRRSVPWDRFLLGVKRSALQPDELILGVRWIPPHGPGSFSKIGTRNAMVISVAGLCLHLDQEGRSVRVALGSVAPTVVRARDAEREIGDVMRETGAWDDPAVELPREAVDAFADAVAAAASPIDDVRGSADYRRHAVRVLARRACGWALEERRRFSSDRGGMS
jgi:CO/xanthine dehydrogenase FAD-binding subunit